MRIKGILSERKIYHYWSFQIVYQWEDIISQMCSWPVYYVTKFGMFFLRNINKVWLFKKVFFYFNRLIPVKNYYLYHCMAFQKDDLKPDCLKNVIPVIIDYWLPDQYLKDFYSYFSSSTLVLITSREVYEHLIKNRCPIRIEHLPVSIPDTNISIDNIYPPKEFDFLFPGRRDPILYGYMLEYEKKHPDVEYLYQELAGINGINPYYVSNKKGRLSEDFFSREGYLSLLKKARITFYATPGMDESKKANGFNQVTPRFLEMLSCGCLVMGRYPKNPDTDFYEMEKYCPSIKNQQEFEETLELFFNEKWAKQQISSYPAYLKKHSTSSSIQVLEDILQKM